jgi:hexosaminidase
MRFLFTLFLVLPLIHKLSGQAVLPLIPQPQSMVPLKGVFKINVQTKIVSDARCAFEAKQLNLFIKQQTGFDLQIISGSNQPKENYIFLQANADDTGLQIPQKVAGLPGQLGQELIADNHESYRLSITPTAVVLVGQTTAGVGHGIQTLIQLTPIVNSRNELLPIQWPCHQIQDRPAFPHRGLLLDCCRHFMSVDFVKKYIDLLAFYKMNVLHWHLTEDQGWRMEIKKYPKLTEVGAYRKEADGSTYGGFYTQQEIKEIVAYATERHVTIIPEIEMPGHSVAALASYPHLGCTHAPIEVENEWGVFKDIYCAGNDSTLQFLRDVLGEVCALFPGPYIHIGGDEAPKYRWEHCERCQKRMADHQLPNEAALQTWLIEEMAAFLATKNKSIIGWDEILEGGIPADAAIQSWRGMQGGEDGAKAQHAVIMSPTSHCYFDYGLNSIDAEKVYQFDPVPSSLTKGEAQYIRGGECNMWTEHAPQNLVDSKVFPRLLAMSEVLWTYPGVRDYPRFSKKLIEHLPLLTYRSVDYGLAKTPATLSFHQNKKGQFIIDIHPNLEDVSFYVRPVPYYSSDFTLTEERTRKEDTIEEVPEIQEARDSIIAKNEDFLVLTPVFRGKAMHDQVLQVCVDQHKGVNKKLTRNFETNKYYPASGANAFVDGLCHVGGFRDGYWQGVVKKDLEVIVDLEQPTAIHFCNSNWYHYANAWIFRPESVSYSGSLDGKTWFTLGTFDSAIAAEDKREAALPYPVWFENKQVRFVKMEVRGIGVCPTWHDAPGEPSWLFGDELIIR